MLLAPQDKSFRWTAGIAAREGLRAELAAWEAAKAAEAEAAAAFVDESQEGRRAQARVDRRAQRLLDACKPKEVRADDCYQQQSPQRSPWEAAKAAREAAEAAQAEEAERLGCPRPVCETLTAIEKEVRAVLKMADREHPAFRARNRRMWNRFREDAVPKKR